MKCKAAVIRGVTFSLRRRFKNLCACRAVVGDDIFVLFGTFSSFAITLTPSLIAIHRETQYNIYSLPRAAPVDFLYTYSFVTSPDRFVTMMKVKPFLLRRRYHMNTRMRTEMPSLHLLGCFECVHALSFPNSLSPLFFLF